MSKAMIRWAVGLGVLWGTVAQAALVSNPDDPRLWQGATVGTFAQLYFGANTLVNRQAVVTAGMLDDGHFDPTGYVAGTMVKFNGGSASAGSYGMSFDAPGAADGNDGTYNYTCCAGNASIGGNAVDNLWIQVTNVIGDSVWDLGFLASKAAVFNTIDHGPLPQESIESTVYLSNDMVNWTQAVTQRVWLEGIYADTSVVWDGFVYAVGTADNSTFRYASIIWGGPGALIADGDNEINGIMGLDSGFKPNNGSSTPSVPEPGSLGLAALALLAARRRLRQR